MNVKLFLCGAFLAPTLALSQTAEPTPLELKMMQTRVFKKSANPVMIAIKSNMEDAGATQCGLIPIDYDTDGSQKVNTGSVHCYFPYKAMKSPDSAGATALSMIPFIGGFAAAAKMQMDVSAALEQQEQQIHQIKFDVNANKGSDETTVRMRITVGMANQKQATFPEIYNKRFKLIADSLFVEALPVRAATQE
jgi:hypothetical protein